MGSKDSIYSLVEKGDATDKNDPTEDEKEDSENEKKESLDEDKFFSLTYSKSLVLADDKNSNTLNWNYSDLQKSLHKFVIYSPPETI